LELCPKRLFRESFWVFERIKHTAVAISSLLEFTAVICFNCPMKIRLVLFLAVCLFLPNFAEALGKHLVIGTALEI